MKTIFITLSILLTANLKSVCQVHPVLGGNANVSYVKTGRYSETLSYGIMPSVGILVNPSLEFGLGFGYSVDNLINQLSDIEPVYIDNGQYYYMYDITVKKMDIAPYFLHHFFHWDKLSLNWGIGIDYSTGKALYNWDRDLENTGTVKSLQGLISAGVTYNISEKIQLTTNLGLLGYSKSKTSFEDSDPLIVDNWNFLVNLNEILLGIRFVL